MKSIIIKPSERQVFNKHSTTAVFILPQTLVFFIQMSLFGVQVVLLIPTNPLQPAGNQWDRAATVMQLHHQQRAPALV